MELIMDNKGLDKIRYYGLNLAVIYRCIADSHLNWIELLNNDLQSKKYLYF